MNAFGNLYKISIYGESHNKSIGVVISGAPAGLPLSEDDFEKDLNSRKAGQFGTTKRAEADLPMILSGVFRGKTTGSPIHISFENKEVRSEDYPDATRAVPRPGHADFTALKKYFGHNDFRGAGHFSGRLTLALVAAGVVAQKVVPYSITSKIKHIGGQSDYEPLLQRAVEAGDSLGGVVETIVSNLEVGIGEPFFDSVESLISHLVFSIPGAKGIEFGAGFEAAKMFGSQYVDPIIDNKGTTLTNNCGGINGGISNGNEIVFRTAFRPASSIAIPINTYNFEKNEMTELSISGRHDACYVLRVPVIVSACTACVLADLFLQRQAYLLEK